MLEDGTKALAFTLPDQPVMPEPITYEEAVATIPPEKRMQVVTGMDQ